MNDIMNICLEQKKEFMYCYFQCDKTCPTVNKFRECTKSPITCLFLFRNKYCSLYGGCGN